MRTRNYSIITALVLLSLVSGATGCKSNGGAWYKPNSYTVVNPFKKDDTIAPYQDRTATTKPSTIAQPNVSTPPGGYGDKKQEAEFLVGKQEKQVQTQYGQTITGGAQPEANRVAMTEPYGSGVPTNMYSDPNGYNPGAYPNQYPQNYQPTSIQQSAAPTNYAPTYQPTTGPNDFGNAPPTSSYSPFAPPAGQYDPALQQGMAPPANPALQQGMAPPAVPAYDPAAQQGFGAPVNSYNGGYGVAPNSYTPPPSYGGSGYTATPSTTGGW